MKQYFILFLFTILYIPCLANKNWTTKTIFVDTITIKNPILVNIDGIGFLNSNKDIDLSNPKTILNSKHSFIVIGDFYDKVFDEDFDIIIMGLDRKGYTEMKDNHFFKVFDPEFNYSKSTKGCDLYNSKLDKIEIAIFLVQIDYINVILNPQTDYDRMPKKLPKKRKIKSAYPNLEYIKVAMPIDSKWRPTVTNNQE